MLMKLGCLCVCGLARDMLGEDGEGGVAAGKTFFDITPPPPPPLFRSDKNLVRNKGVHQHDATHKVCTSIFH